MAFNLIVGVDAGCSSTKVVGPKGEIHFPSTTILEPPGMMKFGNALGIQNKFELTLKDEGYILGDHAEFVNSFNSLGVDSLASGTKNDESAFIRAFGGICLYLDRYEKFDNEDINVYLAYGSPIVSSTHSEEVTEIEDYFKQDGKPHKINYNGHTLNILIKNVIVLPEGIASYYSTDFASQTNYIADVGSQTINLAALVNGIPIPTGVDTIPNGVEYYKKMYKMKAAHMIAQKIKTNAEALRWPEGSTIYVCGGFSIQIAEAFNALKSNPYEMEIMRPELPLARKSKTLEPIFANATGLYFLAKELFMPAVKG